MWGHDKSADRVADDDSWKALRGWLETRGRELDLTHAPRRFSGGLANVNYMILMDGARCVLRHPPVGDLAEGANDMSREAQVLSALPRSYPLAPSEIVFCEDAHVIGVPFQIIEFREGQSVSDRVPEGLCHHPDAPALITQGLVKAMTELHALDPAEAGLDKLGKPYGYLDRQLAGWERRANKAFAGRPPAAIRAVLARLHASIPESYSPRLVHGDFKPDNMLFDPTTLVPTAVLDWDMCTLGDPLMDLAVLLSYWIEPHDPANLHGLGQVPSLDPGFASRQDLADLYATMRGVEIDLTFHLLLARLRLAIVWKQLFDVAQNESNRADHYAAFADIAMNVLAWIADHDESVVGSPRQEELP